jgi:hypothetical protein
MGGGRPLGHLGTHGAAPRDLHNGLLSFASGRHEIVVASAIQQDRFTGTVSPANLGDWLEALERIFSVEVVDQGSNGIQIRARDIHGFRQ